jgi:hypothetical protein
MVHFGSSGSGATFSHHLYVVGWMLVSHKLVEPKAFMGTIAKVGGFHNCLSVSEHGSERYVFKFS